MIQQVCGNCDGQGTVIRNPCTSCRGKGLSNQQVKETINIPKGVDSGVNLRVAKKGNAGLGGPAGDLMIQVKVKAHPFFKRDGADVHTELFISIADVSKLNFNVI